VLQPAVWRGQFTPTGIQMTLPASMPSGRTYLLWGLNDGRLGAAQATVPITIAV
jgi:hypothetical protein